MKIVAQNRKAFHDYFIEETFEAGMILTGTEVKSLRDGKANLKDSYVIIKDAEAFLLNCHISPYSHGRSRVVLQLLGFASQDGGEPEAGCGAIALEGAEDESSAVGEPGDAGAP